MSNVNCRVYRDFKRPPRELIEQFRGIPAANLDDCMGRQAAVDSAIKPIGKAGLVGPALTIKVVPGDNLMFHYAMDLAQEGDVIVIDAGGYTERAIFGEIMVQYLLNQKNRRHHRGRRHAGQGRHRRHRPAGLYQSCLP